MNTNFNWGEQISYNYYYFNNYSGLIHQIDYYNNFKYAHFLKKFYKLLAIFKDHQSFLPKDSEKFLRESSAAIF